MAVDVQVDRSLLIISTVLASTEDIAPEGARSVLPGVLIDSLRHRGMDIESAIEQEWTIGFLPHTDAELQERLPFFSRPAKDSSHEPSIYHMEEVADLLPSEYGDLTTTVMSAGSWQLEHTAIDSPAGKQWLWCEFGMESWHSAGTLKWFARGPMAVFLGHDFLLRVFTRPLDPVTDLPGAEQATEVARELVNDVRFRLSGGT